MTHWSKESIFYHIYPLGLTGAPSENNHQEHAPHRLKNIMPWISHMKDLGANALYIGPLFESSSHGYDTIDYFQIDKRLGENADAVEFVDRCHAEGIHVIFDAVFNHVGRNHFAFQDLLAKGTQSNYKNWFHIDFSKRSTYGDPFWYEGWNGHFSLVKLNLNNPDVKNYLFDAVSFWITEFHIDGLRLDAADCLEKTFLADLRHHCLQKNKEFWLMGEIVHGNYTDWANPQLLHSVTNYEWYKSLWSSHNDANYFEIAYSMNRQFGSDGIYRHLDLYTFADNHDVDRIASKLHHKAHLYPLYILLFTLPGIPSIYYGSEWGVIGKKTNGPDYALRPAFDIDSIRQSLPKNDLYRAVKNLIALRKQWRPLCDGGYRQLYIASKQYAFLRSSPTEAVLIGVNAENKLVPIDVPIPFPDGTIFTDVLNHNDRFAAAHGKLHLPLHSNWGRILVPASK